MSDIEEDEERTVYDLAKEMHDKLLDAKKTKTLESILVSVFGATNLLEFDLMDKDTDFFDHREFEEDDGDAEMAHYLQLMSFVSLGQEALNGRVLNTKKAISAYEYSISGYEEEKEEARKRERENRANYEKALAEPIDEFDDFFVFVEKRRKREEMKV